MTKLNKDNFILSKNAETKETKNLSCEIPIKSLVMDIKRLIKKNYRATVDVEKDNLNVLFNNGQWFVLKVELAQKV